MATPADIKIQAEVQTPPVSESSRGGPKSPTKAKGPSMKHKTRSQTESVRESEKSLQQLLEDFEGGKLNAFGSTSRYVYTFMILFVGNSDTLAKLTKIRKMQEELTLRHFEIDQMRISQEK